MIGQNILHYEILAKLGEGGMGEVYKAEDTRLKRIVALKFLPVGDAGSQEMRMRLLREARAASSLNHPNVSQIYDIGESDAGLFIAMEFIDGGSLRDVINRGPMDIQDALRIGTQIAAGLAAAHAAGVIHRDIKPENVLMTKDGQVKIADFGLSTRGGSTDPGYEQSRAGTAGYMSPEQVIGDTISASSDVWSAGILLYEMLAGHLPYSGPYEQAIFYSILNEQVPPLQDHRGDIPGGIGSIVNKCLEKSPASRYRDAAELLTALNSVVTSSAGGSAIADRGTKTIAVLPFTDASPDSDDKYFSDGLTEEIIARLSKLSDLKVVSRSTVLRYDGASVHPKQAAGELGVRYILAGTVRKHLTDLRITAELVDAAQDTSIWAETYRGELRDVFEIQEKVAAKIVRGMKMHLTPAEKRSLKHRVTQNSEAYQLYLRGRYAWNKRTEEGMRSAIRFFEEAIGLDPRFAPAWSGLADAFNLLGEYSRSLRMETYPRAREAAMKALEIDPRLAEAHASLGCLIMIHEWNWAEAGKELELAVRLNPHYASARQWYAEWLLIMGRAREAVIEMTCAAELEPASPAILKDKGLILYYARRYDEAHATGKLTLDLDPGFFLAHRLISLADQELSRYEEALEENRLWGDLIPQKSHSVAAEGLIRARMGHTDRAREILRGLEAEMVSDGNLARGIALLCTGLADLDAAFRWLAHAFALGADSMSTLNTDPKVDRLRNDPRFSDLLRKLRLIP